MNVNEKERGVLIVDGRWVGIDGGKGGLDDDRVMLLDALELVSALIPMQTPHGMGSLRVCMVHPIAGTQVPKNIVVRYSTILSVEDDLDENEQKQLNAQIAACLDGIAKNKRQRETGLITPG